MSLYRLTVNILTHLRGTTQLKIVMKNWTVHSFTRNVREWNLI